MHNLTQLGREITYSHGKAGTEPCCLLKWTGPEYSIVKLMLVSGLPSAIISSKFAGSEMEEMTRQGIYGDTRAATGCRDEGQVMVVLTLFVSWCGSVEISGGTLSLTCLLTD